MAVRDKTGVLDRLGAMGRVRVELGCGATKRKLEAIGVDVQDLPGVDLVGDVFDALSLFPAGSVDEVASYHFFEHVDDLARLLEELGRVMKSGGRLGVVVPHFSNPYFYSDYTHRRFFGLYTFCYLARGSLFRRQVPAYGITSMFELQDVRLGFKSTRPFYFRYALKYAIGALFNSSRWMQEFYEENLCWVLPCYELSYTLRRID
jgi:SAM-dependent methyltransferase